MRILWVEDNEQLPEGLIKQWFGEFGEQHQIERHHGFTEAYRCIQTQIRNYDCVILDINLENREISKISSRKPDFIYTFACCIRVFQQNGLAF